MSEAEPKESSQKASPDDPHDPALQGIGIALLLTLAAVLVAIIAGRASYLSASAATHGQTAIREEVKQAAAYVESIRYIYGVEVRRAMPLTEARFRAEEFTKLTKDQSVPGPAQVQLEIEAAVQEGIVEALGPASELGSNPDYRTEEGFDPIPMLIDDRNAIPSLIETDPDSEEHLAEESSDKAVRLVGVTVILAFAFLFGCVARAFPSGRRLWLTFGFVFMGLGVAAAVFVEVV